MSALSLVDVVTALEATRDKLLDKAGRATVAIDALRNLLTEADMAPRALPPARIEETTPAAASRQDSRGHQAHGSARPTTGTCQNEACGKAFPIGPRGRIARFCSPTCKTAHYKRAAKAAATDPADELLVPREPIPESGQGMKARISQVLARPEAPRSRFLETVRGRNAEAARRNAAAR